MTRIAKLFDVPVSEITEFILDGLPFSVEKADKVTPIFWDEVEDDTYEDEEIAYLDLDVNGHTVRFPRQRISSVTRKAKGEEV